jgi:hypothetical protein
MTGCCRAPGAAILLAAWLAACGDGATKAAPSDAREVSPTVVATAATASAAPARPKRTPAAIGGTRRSPSLRESRVITELMSAAERVRSLRFKRPVPVLVEDRARITDYVSSQLEEEELERARIVYTALGLLPVDLDVRGLLLRLMGEQVVGYYDADEKHLVVRDDVMRGFTQAHEPHESDDNNDLGEARIVLLHELVHALQDQNLQLSSHIHAERDTDASNAFHALVEGDATLAMIGYALEREQIPLHRLTGNPTQVRSFSDVVRRSPLAGSELELAPAIVRVPLLSSYVDGLAFAASLHGSGGFAAVDRAHANPPASTEQVLHPERYAPRPDAPTPVVLPELPQLSAAGYELVREDTLGELEMGVYLGQDLPEDQAKSAALGWDGDRIRVYRAKNRPAAVVWLSVWDSDSRAEQAAGAAQRVVAMRGKELRARCSVEQHGKTVLVLRDLEPGLRDAVASAILPN